MPTKRVLISLDADLLDRIDRAARRAGATRSGYLRQLAEADLSSAHVHDDGIRAASVTGELAGVPASSAPSQPRSGG